MTDIAAGFRQARPGFARTRTRGGEPTMTAMKKAYGVTWCEADRESATGMLELGPHALVLEADERISRELRYDELVGLTLLVVPDGAPRLVLTAYDGRDVELVSSVDAWIIRDLLDKLVEQALGSDIPLRFLVSCQAVRPGLGLS